MISTWLVNNPISRLKNGPVEYCNREHDQGSRRPEWVSTETLWPNRRLLVANCLYFIDPTLTVLAQMTANHAMSLVYSRPTWDICDRSPVYLSISRSRAFRFSGGVHLKARNATDCPFTLLSGSRSLHCREMVRALGFATPAGWSQLYPRYHFQPQDATAHTGKSDSPRYCFSGHSTLCRVFELVPAISSFLEGTLRIHQSASLDQSASSGSSVSLKPYVLDL